MTMQFPFRLQFLMTEHARYKVVYGGRGSAKSWSMARALLLKGTQRKLKIMCCREIQNSIKESVHALLKLQIWEMGLQGFYDVTDRTIRGRNGSEFIFEGLRHNINTIRSIEGVDICWVEEANNVSKNSWEVLIPTIRRLASEIWISFNPELDTDETYKRFVIDRAPGAIVVECNWRHNPWFPETLRLEMEALKEKDHDAYLTIWEGKTRHTLDGAIYSKELRRAAEDGRICHVPYNKFKPVYTFWDLGWNDMTSIWFGQINVPGQYDFIRFIQARQTTVTDFLAQMQSFKYVYATDFLPHDGAAKNAASQGRSVERIMKEAGRTVRIIPRIARKSISINAGRTFFDLCRFDEKLCGDGLNCLRRYRYAINEQTQQFTKDPLHDDNCHAADAYQGAAMAFTEPKEKRKPAVPPPSSEYMEQGWMQ